MSRPDALIILGGGGLAREIAWLARATGWRVAGYLAPAFHAGIPPEERLGDDAALAALPAGTALALGVGQPALALTLLARALEGGFSLPNLADPSVTGDWARIHAGGGNRFCAGVRLTTDIRIGNGNLFNLNVTVGHDVAVGDGCTVNPGANLSGGVTLGDGCLVGTGAQILEGQVIGSGATVGAGAVVTRDVPPGVTVVGIPARPRAPA